MRRDSGWFVVGQRFGFGGFLFRTELGQLQQAKHGEHARNSARLLFSEIQ